jgi:hypothetical protein
MSNADDRLRQSLLDLVGEDEDSTQRRGTERSDEMSNEDGGMSKKRKSLRKASAWMRSTNRQ